MGCGSRAGKMEQHCDSKPEVDEKTCRGCGTCQKICAHGALQFNENHKMHINTDKCVGCGRCIGMIKTFLMILMFSSSALAGDSCCDISSD